MAEFKPPAGYKIRNPKYCFQPGATEPFRISRSKIDLFTECPRCFYLDQRLGIGRPSWPAFSLNNAVDELLKREFDTYREKQAPHPFVAEAGIDAVPFKDPRMEAWRDAMRRGVEYHHKPTNLILRGGVDDIWINKAGELIVVDYKATSKKEEVSIEGYWQQGYKRQMEVYQWLLRNIGETVSPTAYFVYVNADSEADLFDKKLEFSVRMIPYEGDDSWIEPTVTEIAACLGREALPPVGERCEYCPYREAAGKALQTIHRKQSGKRAKKAAEPSQIKPLF